MRDGRLQWADAADQADVHGLVLVVLLQQHSAQDIGTLENPWRGGSLAGSVHSTAWRSWSRATITAVQTRCVLQHDASLPLAGLAPLQRPTSPSTAA